MKLTETILSILTTICIALAGFSLKWTFDANAKLEVLQEQVKQIADNKEKDDSQDNQIRMFWKYCKWLHNEVNILRFKEHLPPESPDLN